MILNKGGKNQKGFTILELIIATTVFSVMLLLVSAGIIQIGKTYYKGITTSRTQETARAIIDDLFRTFQTGNNTTVGYSFTPPDPTDPDPVFPPNGSICIGSTRYTYQTGSIVGRDGNQHALWIDRIVGTECKELSLTGDTPADDVTDLSTDGQFAQKELIAQNMRLASFEIMNIPGTSLYTIGIRVIHGDQDLSPDDEFCLPTNQGGEFCAVSSINTFVKTRLD